MAWNNGKSASGKWQVKDGLLKIKFNDAPTSDDYYILELSESKLKYQLSDKTRDQTIYNATKIGTE